MITVETVGKIRRRQFVKGECIDKFQAEPSDGKPETLARAVERDPEKWRNTFRNAGITRE